MLSTVYSPELAKGEEGPVEPTVIAGGLFEGRVGEDGLTMGGDEGTEGNTGKEDKEEVTKIGETVAGAVLGIEGVVDTGV